ncbi:MAG: class I SAM-dependent methyltransferase [Anaerolineae bacterium]
MKNHNRFQRWAIGLGGLALVTGLLVWLRHRTDKVALQRHFWDVVYDRLAALYDAVDWFTGGTTHRLRQRALRYLPPEGSRVLEIGFGSGRLHVELAERYTMAGLDRAPGMVHLTQQRLAEHGLTSDLQVGDVTAIPWAEESFDAVLSTFTFSAVPDADAALAEMVRVVKPGGAIIIVDAGEAQDDNTMAHFLARLWSAFGDYMRDEVPLMEAQGLTVTREDYGPWRCVHVTVGTKPR